MLPFPVLLGDIGGTFARFAVCFEPGAPEVLLAKTPTGLHPDVLAAAREALQRHTGPRPKSLVIAAAGPVAHGVIRLTNAEWSIDPETIGAALDLQEAILVNDYAATAAGLPGLCARAVADLRQIGSCEHRAGPQLVLGPGTGLGAAALLPFGTTKVIQSTEAGHVELGPVHDREFRIWPLLDRVRGRITAEALLSGPGIFRLYRAISAAHSAEPVLDSPAAVVASGLKGDALAAEALDTFASVLGRFAGDLALIFGAAGGVFIAGGVAPRIAALLDSGPFRREFEEKAPFSDVMRQTPTYLILRSEPVLAGLSAIAADPGGFLMRAVRWRKPTA